MDHDGESESKFRYVVYCLTLCLFSNQFIPKDWGIKTEKMWIFWVGWWWWWYWFFFGAPYIRMMILKRLYIFSMCCKNGFWLLFLLLILGFFSVAFFFFRGTFEYTKVSACLLVSQYPTFSKNLIIKMCLTTILLKFRVLKKYSLSFVYN